MTTQEIYMDVPAVKRMGRRFEDIGEVLEKISTVMQALLSLLKATAFVGMFGGWAIQAYLEQLKPTVDRLAEQSKEIGSDLAFSAQAYENGDEAGGTRFY